MAELCLGVDNVVLQSQHASYPLLYVEQKSTYKTKSRCKSN